MALGRRPRRLHFTAFRPRGAAIMQRFILVSLALWLLGVGNVRGADSSPFVIEAKIMLGQVQGRIDHLGVDLGRQRLYVAELGNDSVGVVDLKARRVIQTLRGLKEPQGIGYEPLTDTL